jgi:hypothetical protein
MNERRDNEKGEKREGGTEKERRRPLRVSG